MPIKQNGTKLVFGFAQHDTIVENISEILRLSLWIMGSGMTKTEVEIACLLQAFVLILCKYCLSFYITAPAFFQYGRLYSVELQGVW